MKTIILRNAIRVGAVQLDSKMHILTPWVRSRLLLIIHDRSHFHRRGGFVGRSPAHVHREMNGEVVDLSGNQWTVPIYNPTTGRLYPVQLVWTIQLFAPIKGRIEINFQGI
jgi:hypothetical protein